MGKRITNSWSWHFPGGGPLSLEMDKVWPAQDFFTEVMAKLGR